MIDYSQFPLPPKSVLSKSVYYGRMRRNYYIRKKYQAIVKAENDSPIAIGTGIAFLHESDRVLIYLLKKTYGERLEVKYITDGISTTALITIRKRPPL